jgi:hypothetical protein
MLFGEAALFVLARTWYLRLVFGTTPRPHSWRSSRWQPPARLR